MKKVFSLFIALIILFSYSLSFASNLDIVGESAVLIDYDTMEVLYEKNAHMKLYPASTTKIMTGILAIELGNLDDMIVVDAEVIVLTEGSHIALDYDEEMSLENMVYGLLVASANDAAYAIAKHIGKGDISAFVNLMNEKAKEIGAKNTYFVNPNGLPDEKHVSTAYDLALIGRYAMENPKFREIVNTYTYTIPTTNKKSEERYLWSSNRMLFSTDKVDLNGEKVSIKMDGINGIKSGYTLAAQQCLVTSYEKDGHKLIAVVLKSEGTNIYSDIMKLINYGVDNFEKVPIGLANKFVDNFSIENGNHLMVAGITKTDSYYVVAKGQADSIQQKIQINENLKAPIEKGQVIGKYEYFLNGNKIGETDIISTMNVDLVAGPSIVKRILSKWYLGVFLLLIVLKVISTKNRRKRRQMFRKSRGTIYG